MHQEILMKPTVRELSPRERAIVEVAHQEFLLDKFHQEKKANFSPDVHPQFIGFYISRPRNEAVPVYNTDNGIFAVNHYDGGVTSWRVGLNDVYSLDS